MTFSDNKLACSIFSGSVSGLLGGIAALPRGTRTRLSIQTKDPIYRSVFDGLNQMRKIGIREFFHGLTPTMIGFVSHFVELIISNVYYLQGQFYTDKRSYWFNLQNLIYGTISAICALAIVYPTDCLRKKMHLQNFKSTDNPVMQYDNFRHCLSHTFKTEGIRGFYRGMIAGYQKLLPSNAISFMILSFKD